MSNRIHFFFVFIALILFLGSCRNSDRDLDTDTTIAKSYILSEQYFSDPFFWTHKLMANQKVTQTGVFYIDSLEECLTNASIVRDPQTGITDISFTFDETVTCNDRRIRRGNLAGRIWGNYKDENATIRITSSFYYINGLRLQMVDSLENLGRNLDSSLIFSSQVRNAKMSNDTTYIEWDANHQWTWTEGEEDGAYFNDLYEGTGLIKSLSFNGNTFTAEIIEPLIRDVGCFWIAGGEVNQQPENILPRTITFGDANNYCDNEVGVKISQRDYTIKID